MTRRALLVAAAALAAVPLWAQISPGPLSRAHASLEGSTQCAKCHESGSGSSRERCLACHLPLKARIDAGSGLHAGAAYRKCETCHIEHQGSEADLVWWGKDGRASFRHDDTGFPLEGAHARVACERCHRRENIAGAAELAKAGVRLDRTYLGLGRACLACHQDPHRGQLPDCRTCHTLERWKPAGGFDHARAAYPLTGRHASVACEKCHVAASDASGASYRRYKGLRFDGCASCHEDPHRGRLGASCASCHSTEGWSRVDKTSFDHERTRYPLQGRHRLVTCGKCHEELKKPLRFERCSDCHADAHRGQLREAASSARCESCHDVSGFVPARFGLEEHAKTTFPLAGAHRAVACDECHRKSGRGGASFRVRHERCADCHDDPHKGEVDRYVRSGGCESCHNVESWRRVSFDHASTRFALDGAHAQRACGACHTPVDAGTPRERVRFASVPTTCDACHKDVHGGQLAVATRTDCARCHDTARWVPASRFDHGRDSSYRLTGKHAQIACAACHARKTRDGRPFMHFKPLGTECRDCHGKDGKGGGP